MQVLQADCRTIRIPVLQVAARDAESRSQSRRAMRTSIFFASSFGANVGSAAAVSASYAGSVGHGDYANAVRSQGFFGALPSIAADRGNQLLSSLPTELLVDMFSFACGRYHSDRRAFVRTRSAIACTCRLWCLLIDAVPHFWSAYTVTPHKLVADVRRWTSHWSTGILDLKLKCDTLYSLIYSVSTASAPRMFPSRTIAVLAPYFSRCSRLCLVLEDRTALPDVLRRLRRTSAEFLVSFALSRVTLPFARGQVLRVVFRPPRLFARSDFPRLRRLLLSNATVGWCDLRYYAALYDLIFIDLLYPVDLSTFKLYRILQRAVCLARLCLRRVPCADLLDLTLPPLSLPSLRVLELDIDESVGVSCVLAVCNMPALSSLSICIGGDDDLAFLVQCAYSMRTITALSINGTAQDVALITTLYSYFPLLLSLDLSRATPTYFQALYDPARGVPHMFPLLEVLSVIDVSLSDIRIMLERRTSLPSLWCLIVSRASERESLSALVWCLTAFPTEEQFVVDPEPTFVRPWFEDA
ncbi:hypothetical protein C8F04DRAFT_1256786 [Mycena alexandri]|uniref:F-box domain-containing protein n=1 Tax=Mycena alexandri TaxID=1745969 RepID=A0AAD6T0M2_9AGAR|nr:hypothetical protein C8F04DRAFT_1256786 [Mycena alexandri]